jgi:SAM-dependent methyltransferase
MLHQLLRREPDPLLTEALAALPAGDVLDLACGTGRHAEWLAQRGWNVTAVDMTANALPGIRFVQADLERGEFRIEPDAWDAIVCWLYWQPDLLPQIARGVRQGGIVALAGKTTGRFATSLAEYRKAFAGWTVIASGEDEVRAFFLARRPHY